MPTASLGEAPARRSPNVRERARETAKALRKYVVGEFRAGRLKPGDRLPTERVLTEMFASGRPAVRRALESMEKDGWLAREVGRGTFLKSSPDGGLGSGIPLSNGNERGREHDCMDFTGIARRASPLDVMELRLSLEPDVVELSVSRASGSEIDAMYKCLDEARVARTLEDFEHWDDALHRTIAGASRNPLYVAVFAMISAVRLEAQWGQLKRRTLTDELKKMHFDEHVRIVDAIRDRDAVRARQEMVHHLTHIKRNMFER